MKEVLDTKAVRRMFEGSDHYVVLAKIKIRSRWSMAGKLDREK